MNGNLLRDGNGGGAEYTYNGLGDRLTETAPSPENSSLWETKNYTLDLNTGLTQVLSDGTTTYTYGLGRISQQSGTTPEYFLGDALGSVRQMTNQAGGITFARNYDPYGVVTYTSGTSQTEFGFTGEQYGDSTQLLYLRARYYNVNDGRFQSRDTWSGDANRPLSLNRWMYVEGNPVNATDPSGLTPLRLGYMEGYSTSAGVLEGNIQGNEIVYDYATMSRARFRYSGIGGLAFSSIGGAIYTGEINGFNYEPKPLPIGLDGDVNLPYSNLIVEDYRGGSTGAYGGISLPIIRKWLDLTLGVGYFQSDTGGVKGIFSYASLGKGLLPGEVVGFHTTYSVASGIKYYYDADTGRVNRAELISDILSGNISPIPLGALPSLTAYVGGSRTGQISAILLAARRFEKYYYQPQYGQCRDGIQDPDLELPDPFEIPPPFPVP